MSFNNYIALLSLLLVTVLTASCGGSKNNSSEPPQDGFVVPAKPAIAVELLPKHAIVTWEDVPDATYYQVYTNLESQQLQPYGEQIELKMELISLSIPLAAHLINWEDTQILVEACSVAGCSQSETVSINDRSLEAIEVLTDDEAVGTGGQFGYDVVISDDGSTIAVLQPRNEGSDLIIFERQESGWNKQVINYLLEGSDDTILLNAVENSLSISADGSTIVVGVRMYVGVERELMLTFAVYTREDSIWENYTILAAQFLETDTLGQFTAISGDGNTIAAYGSEYDTQAGDSSFFEHIFTFTKTNDIWLLDEQLQTSNYDKGDEIGWMALDYNGSTLAVSARFEDSNAVGINGDQDNNESDSSGAVYVFEKTEAGWEQTTYIKSDNIEPGDRFGSSVDLSNDGTVIVATATHEDGGSTQVNSGKDDNSNENSGAIYVFRATESSWEQEAYIKPTRNIPNANLGRRAKISGDGNFIVVGAILEGAAGLGVNDPAEYSDLPEDGAAYIFEYNEGNWSQKARLRPLEYDMDSQFGWSVDINGNGDTAVVGSRFKNFADGAIYVY